MALTEEQKERKREYMKRYRQEHHDEIMAYKRKYREEHREEIREQNREYKRRHYVPKDRNVGRPRKPKSISKRDLMLRFKQFKAKKDSEE